jgi:hypothetical protein
MRRIISIFALLALSSLTWGQCTQANPGTVCVGPLTVDPGSGNTLQSSEILVDLGLPAPPPTATQYILSIVSGEVQESDNGGPYHTLVGPAGTPGATATISIGAVSTGAPGSQATVTNTGTQQAAVFSFSIPAGQSGSNGAPASVTVGTTSTGAPGSQASVSNSGTPQNAIFNFTVPAGATGPPGTGFSVGTVITGVLSCPKGKGSVPVGFSTANCTFKITAIN